jgi:hypothetical protein
MDQNIANNIIQHSGTIVNWCLSIVGGSILVIISGDYVRPVSRKMRLFYLLFIPGWFFLGWAVKSGVNVANQGIMSVLMQKDEAKMIEIMAIMGDSYSKQLFFFNIGLIFFGIWVLVFLIAWILGKI